MKRIHSIFRATIVFSTLTVLVASCQKEPSLTNKCEQTLAGLSGTYKLSALVYKRSATATPVDYLALMDACEKDDLVELKSNGTYIYTDAGTVCAPDGSDNGTWSVNGNTIISDGVVAGRIQSYDCRTLVLYTTDVSVPGDNYTMTLTKQ